MSRTILLAAFFSGIFIGALSIIVIVVAKTYNFGQKPHENISRPYNYGCAYGKNGKYCDMCGITSQDVNVRVVGGIPAWPHSFPAQVHIRFDYKIRKFFAPVNETITIKTNFTCGGTLINRDTVLTAGHCIPIDIEFEYENITYVTIVERNPFRPTWESMFKVYLGMSDISGVWYGNLKGGIEMNVATVIRHPEYDDKNSLNDIGILKLDGEVQLNSKIQLACLPDPAKPDYPTQTGSTVYAIGWGLTNYKGTASNVLQNVNLTYLDDDKCKVKQLDYEKDFKRQLCAGDLNTGKDSCEGDSGSGLYMKDSVENEIRMVAVGIVSYGFECGKNVPAIYTRISAYLQWIDSFA